MNLNLDATQIQLAAAVKGWAAKHYSFQEHQRICAAGGFSQSAYAALAELGLCGLRLDERHGGMGLGAVEAMAVMQELGYGLVLEPLREVMVCGGLLQQYAGEAPWAREVLAGMSGGACLVVLAHQERATRYALDAIDTRAQRTEDQWTLTGAKSLVAAGDVAHGFLVSALADGGEPALFYVAASTRGIEAHGYTLQDGSRAAELRFEACEAELVTLRGRAALDQACALGVAAVCAQGVGVMSKVMEITIDYLKTRKQFGVLIGKFQVLRHFLADMHIHLETAKCMSAYATMCVDDALDDRRLALAQAKYQLGMAMRFIGQHAVQIHGGMGLVDEYVMSHLFRKLTQLELTLGDTAHCLDAMSTGMKASVSTVLRAPTPADQGASTC